MWNGISSSRHLKQAEFFLLEEEDSFCTMFTKVITNSDEANGPPLERGNKKAFPLAVYTNYGTSAQRCGLRLK